MYSKVSMYGNIAVGIAVEIGRAAIFHLGAAIYMIHRVFFNLFYL